MASNDPGPRIYAFPFSPQTDYAGMDLRDYFGLYVSPCGFFSRSQSPSCLIASSEGIGARTATWRSRLEIEWDLRYAWSGPSHRSPGMMPVPQGIRVWQGSHVRGIGYHIHCIQQEQCSSFPSNDDSMCSYPSIPQVMGFMQAFLASADPSPK
jgi:hypothetical protein